MEPSFEAVKSRVPSSEAVATVTGSLCPMNFVEEELERLEPIYGPHSTWRVYEGTVNTYLICDKRVNFSRMFEL